MYLSNIYTYPIKSTSPIAITTGYLFSTGVAYDRHWMLVDENNTMLTARKNPKLLHIKTQFDGANLVVKLPFRDFLLPLKPEPQKQILVDHWGDTPFSAWPQNDALDAALSEYLQFPCRLVYSASLAQEPLIERVSFADAQPLLLTTSASLTELNQRLDSSNSPTGPSNSIGMERFRTNLVVHNAVADIEDNWHRIRIGACELEVTAPCERCILTTIDPGTLERHPSQEPLRTLGKYRRLEGAGVGFGINLKVISGGIISVNDRVQVLS
tara:strand:- start:63 stop:869 length:807 start_codon:yes stop_codon:yes gene_type:complete